MINYLDVQGIWRDCWLKAPDGAGTFLDQLTIYWQSVRRLNAAGSLSNISKNSASQASAFGGSYTQTTVDMERGSLEAILLYERMADLIDTTDEDVIYTHGLFQLKSVPSEACSDISSLRFT